MYKQDHLIAVSFKEKLIFKTDTKSFFFLENLPQVQRFQLMETKLSNLSLAHRSTLLFIVRHLAKYVNQSISC